MIALIEIGLIKYINLLFAREHLKPKIVYTQSNSIDNIINDFLLETRTRNSYENV